jgi:hypothetical protein
MLGMMILSVLSMAQISWAAFSGECSVAARPPARATRSQPDESRRESRTGWRPG